ncbi:MAG: hypothetical protein HC904_05450 [Blastochloris sp.]|nr:hypothetical protein [Blastochloris sp.]
MSITTSQLPMPSGQDFTTGSGVTYNVDDGNPGGIILESFVTGGGTTYNYLALPFEVEFQRSTPSDNTANLAYFKKSTSTTPNQLVGAPVATMEQAFNQRDLSAGVENIFDNTTANFNKSIERIDYVNTTGLTLETGQNPSDFGFAFFERNGNNNFNVAAVTGVDGSGNVTSIGTIVRFGPGTGLLYGAANLTGFTNSSTLQGTIADPIQDVAFSNTGSQDLGGVFITLSDLGISAGSTIFGYVIMGGDQTTVPASINNFAAYNLSTNSSDNGGGDLFGGGMIFESENRNLYWDTNDTGGGAVIDGTVASENTLLSSGEWRYGGTAGTETRWGNVNGSIATQGWVNNKRAVFSAGTDASGNTYTVTIRDNTTILASDLRFEEGNVTIAATDVNDSLLQLNRVFLGDPEIDVQIGNTATINARLQGSDGFVLRDNSGNSGTGRLILTGNNTISGAATVEEGTLELAGTGSNQSLGGINSIDMNSGTLLLLSAANEINDTANLTLRGATVQVNNLSGHTETLGTLTLTATSTLNLGTGSSIINFANSAAAPWTGGSAFRITNWSGIPSTDGINGGGGTDQVYFGTTSGGLTASQLSQIVFINPFGDGIDYGAIILADGEVVPVPEPSTWLTASLLLLFIIAWERRRRIRKSESDSNLNTLIPET